MSWGISTVHYSKHLFFSAVKGGFFGGWSGTAPSAGAAGNKDRLRALPGGRVSDFFFPHPAHSVTRLLSTLTA